MNSSAVQDSQISKRLFVVVDDFEWVRKLAKWRLENAFGPDIRVELASTGMEAVNLFRNLIENGSHRHINTVFIDYHMPELTGVDAIRVLRLLENWHNLPAANVVGCSGDLTPSCEREFYDAGANATLAKPVEFGEMESLCLTV